eukprot:CAMPEP_0168435886 /NCGR_PEP_ID=MMETSP0228-20121227/40648_1 /TAXON_ID=133427 /ORGANISM="Protoceratium reticulatum, Strain CCCM 535 (=CCMP 1889)" /LENGTH=134 /DNA_ID=CAMNT_0008450079 /DNA_START=28 /DNA_END=429 /DNA_ORIENTATION=-
MANIGALINTQIFISHLFEQDESAETVLGHDDNGDHDMSEDLAVHRNSVVILLCLVGYICPQFVTTRAMDAAHIMLSTVEIARVLISPGSSLLDRFAARNVQLGIFVSFGNLQLTLVFLLLHWSCTVVALSDTG